MTASILYSTLRAVMESDSEYYETSTLNPFKYVDETTAISVRHNTQLSLYGILIPALGFIVIFLNLAVVISSGLILKKGSQPRSTYLFLGNVAMSDLTTAVSILFGNFYPKENRSQTTCGIQLGLIVSSTIVSIYSVGLIALDRYLYIIHGLQYQRWVYPTRARILILFTWILGCLVGFLPIMGWSGDTYNGKKCWFITLVPPKLILTICAIGLIPILEVVVLYSIILYHAMKKVIQLKSAGKQTQKNDNDLRIFRGKTSITKTDDAESQAKELNIFNRYFKKPKQDVNEPSKSKAIKVVLFTTGSFIITWVPYFVTSFLYVNCDEKITPKRCKNLEILIASPLAILGFFNSVLNPIIYAWWHRGFRDFVKKMFTKTKQKFTRSQTNDNLDKSISYKKTSSTLDTDTNTEPPMVSIDLNAH